MATLHFQIFDVGTPEVELDLVPWKWHIFLRLDGLGYHTVDSIQLTLPNPRPEDLFNFFPSSYGQTLIDTWDRGTVRVLTCGLLG